MQYLDKDSWYSGSRPSQSDPCGTLRDKFLLKKKRKKKIGSSSGLCASRWIVCERVDSSRMSRPFQVNTGFKVRNVQCLFYWKLSEDSAKRFWWYYDQSAVFVNAVRYMRFRLKFRSGQAVACHACESGRVKEWADCLAEISMNTNQSSPGTPTFTFHTNV